MTTPDTRPAITEEQLQRLLAAIQRSGASVNVSDPRVTSLQTWLLGLVGTGVVAGLVMVGSSVIDLRAEFVAWRTRWEMVMDHEQRLRQLERRP
jgi:hypothetical protein